jgi:hypothetical protein
LTAAVISATLNALIEGSEAGLTPIILAIPGLGVPVEPWQVEHFALYVASPESAKARVPAREAATANIKTERTIFVIVRLLFRTVRTELRLPDKFLVFGIQQL